MLKKKELITIEFEHLKKLIEARQHFWYFMESYEEMLMDRNTTVEEIMNMSEQFEKKLKKINRKCSMCVEIGKLVNELE